MLFRFDQYELDEDRYELRPASGVTGERAKPIELQPKVMEVLLQLVRSAERTLTKDELLDAVWGDVAITEASLTRCISLARRALGEHEGEPRIIQTVRGRGYRIGVEVEAVETGAEASLPATATPTEDLSPDGERRGRSPVRRAGLAAAVGLSLVLALAWLARPFRSDIIAPEPKPVAPYPPTAVAVLPFGDLREPSSRSLSVDGLALEVIEHLSRWPELQVTSYRSSFRFSPTESIDPVATGQSLGVGTLVTGSLRPDGDDGIRLQVELVDTESGFQRWSESFAMRPEELLRSQERIANQIGKALGLSVAARNPLKRAAAYPEARRLFFEGRRAVFEADRAALLEAVAIYERALEMDPDLIRGYVALAEAYHRLWERDGEIAGRGESWLPAAEAVALEALERAPEDPDSLTIYGTIRTAQKDWTGAEAALRLALRHHGGALASNRLAVLLMIRGRIQDARPHVERALRLDPLDHDVLRGIGRFHLYAGEPRQAVSMLERALELEAADPWAPRLLANAHDMLGDREAARESLGRLMPAYIRPLSRIHTRLLGSDRTIRNLLAVDILGSGQTCRRDAYGTAMMWAYLRERDRMIECLEIAARLHLWYVVSEPAFRPYHGDPRFREIVSNAGFEPSAGWQLAEVAAPPPSEGQSPLSP